MAQRVVDTDFALKGNKSPYPHRFHLVDGRIVEGLLYRDPDSRLADDLYGMKGDFISITDARCKTTGNTARFMAINLSHIVSIQEI